jgi:hypothetical protein
VSYDILLYERDFLCHALQQSLGDWTTAPALPEKARERLTSLVISSGFIERPADPGFVAFARSQGHKVGREFALTSAERSAEFTLFESSGSFSVPAGPTAVESVAFCAELARRAAREAQLGVYDPQTGEGNV